MKADRTNTQETRVTIRKLISTPSPLFQQVHGLSAGPDVCLP